MWLKFGTPYCSLNIPAAKKLAQADTDECEEFVIYENTSSVGKMGLSIFSVLSSLLIGGQII